MDALPCDETDERCELVKVELLPENELAYELYFTSRMEGIGPFALELARESDPELRRMTQAQAYELLDKFRVLASVMAEIEQEEIKRMEKQGKGT